MRLVFACFAVFLINTIAVFADDNISAYTPESVDPIEEPKVLYVIPWQELPKDDTVIHKIVIQDLFEDIYEPQMELDE